SPLTGFLAVTRVRAWLLRAGLLKAGLLKAGRGGVEDGLDRLHQGAGRVLAELDGHPAGRAERGGEEVEVERVAERRVHRVVQVDAAVGDLDPAGRALGAALDRDLLGDVRAHGRNPSVGETGHGLPGAAPLAGSGPSGPAGIISSRSLAMRTNPAPGAGRPASRAPWNTGDH